jgi:hypothetical protein
MSGFLSLALTSAPIPLLAPDGDLDPTFGIGGRVRYEDSSGHSLGARASAIQSDGRIIVAGSIGVTPDGSDFVLARFKADGLLDTAFGIGGKADPPVHEPTALSRAIRRCSSSLRHSCCARSRASDFEQQALTLVSSSGPAEPHNYS